ncbi:MAG: glycyl radical protein [SAR324 cluster bacterium]|nr:glycyl radical protein [SAR324 cluster bacterium]
MLKLAESCLGGKSDRFNITKEDAAELKEDILPYWQDKSYFEAVINAFPEETQNLTTRDGSIYSRSGIIMPSQATRHSAQWVPDYEKVLKKGYQGLKKEAQKRIEQLDPLDWQNKIEKIPFLEAVITTCEAVIILAKRYAREARKLAKKESDPQRKAELLDIAEVCSRVPEKPAQTLREAIQSQWFVQLMSRLEQKTGGVVSNGRMDQYLYPFYANDIEEGRITADEAQELLEHLWFTLANYVEMYSGGDTGAVYTEGYAHWESVTIGGKTKDGRDASNELSHIMLKSKREFPLNYPDFGARIHSQTPDKFLFDVCETIKDGSGTPKLMNDEEVIPYYLAMGATIEEANDYAVSGCAEARLMNRETYSRGVTWLNLGAAMEMTLNNGKIKIFNNHQFGVSTGDPRNFKSYDELFNAFQTQLQNMLKHTFTAQYVADKLGAQYLASPVVSMLNDTCLHECKDLQTGNIANGIHRAEFDYVGYATAIDSLTAMKQIVFDEKKISMEKMLEALDMNFEGQEALRRLCLKAPKFGNNDAASNAVGLAIERIGVEFCHKYPMFNGGKMHVRYIPITTHIPFGFLVGATPNGRKANTYLSEGSSPTQGHSSEGISGMLLSNAATKCNEYLERASRLLNVKLAPTTVVGRKGTQKMMSLVRSWLDLKLWHIQFNIVNKSTLQAAQENPEQYKDLIIRVAGYNAYFVDLTPDLQNEIIARTEYEL